MKTQFEKVEGVQTWNVFSNNKRRRIGFVAFSDELQEWVHCHDMDSDLRRTATEVQDIADFLKQLNEAE